MSIMLLLRNPGRVKQKKKKEKQFFSLKRYVIVCSIEGRRKRKERKKWKRKQIKMIDADLRDDQRISGTNILEIKTLYF